MKYASLCYVRHNGKIFSKGEIIPDLTEEEAVSLIRRKAVCAVSEEAEEENGGLSDKSNESATGAFAPGPLRSEATEMTAEPAEETEPEPEEDEEAPEIDALDGIVDAPAEEPKKPARGKGSRKKGA